MVDRSLSFRLFRYAMASAEFGSFRRAAAALNVQKSSVSKGVRILEHSVGASLFERSYAGVRPTQAGETFLQEAALGFDHLERAFRRIDALQHGQREGLVIAASVPFFMLGDALEQFLKKQPSVSIEIVEGTCETSVLLVEQRKADIAFTTKIAANGTVQSLHLSDEPLVAVLPRSHQLARQRGVAPEDLRSETIILGASGLGPAVAQHLNRHLSRSDGELNVQFHRTGQCDVVSMVARGFGVSIILGSLGYPVSDGVVLIPITGIKAVPIYAVWMIGNPNLAISTMLDLVPRSVVARAPGEAGYGRRM